MNDHKEEGETKSDEKQSKSKAGINKENKNSEFRKELKLKEKAQQKNDTGIPDQLKSGIENLSGHSMDDVKVHYNSSKPAQLNAHAYAQGNQIHLGGGQEKHLAHEAWHVVQQKQGRVKPTVNVHGAQVNDSASLEKEADVMGTKARSVSKIIQKKSKQLNLKPSLKSDESDIVQRQYIVSLRKDLEDIDEDPVIISCQQFGRTPNIFKGMGAHSTAWSVKEQVIATAVTGKKVTDAYSNIKTIINSVRKSPQGSARWYNNDQLFDISDAAETLLSKKENVAKKIFSNSKLVYSRNQALEELIESFMIYWNALPGSTIDSASTTGKGESSAIKEFNTNPRLTSGDKKKLREATWELFDSDASEEQSDQGDMDPIGTVSEEDEFGFVEVASGLIAQHIWNIYKAFPTQFAYMELLTKENLKTEVMRTVKPTYLKKSTRDYNEMMDDESFDKVFDRISEILDFTSIEWTEKVNE